MLSLSLVHMICQISPVEAEVLLIRGVAAVIVIVIVVEGAPGFRDVERNFPTELIFLDEGRDQNWVAGPRFASGEKESQVSMCADLGQGKEEGEFHRLVHGRGIVVECAQGAIDLGNILCGIDHGDD